MSDIQIVPALAACNQAMRQHPDVSRFVFQAGRVAQAQKDYALAPQLYEKAAGKKHAGELSQSRRALQSGQRRAEGF
jgi:hypothetical protein